MDDIDGEAAPSEDAGNEDPSTEHTGVDRRDLLRKTVVGAGVAGLVWSAPRIEGLSVRPDYAAAASHPTDTDPSQPFDQSFPMDTTGTPGPYTQPGNGFPNLAFGYGWNITGGPSAADFSVSASSDCAITVDADLPGAASPDVIVDSPIQPGQPFPFAAYRRYGFDAPQPTNLGTIRVHFTC
ncbi:MAG: hypothetical protein HYX32_06310 [Actinobacteria bacterium]|nr:hypothetical protein [Actinomycetota bacterium]